MKRLISILNILSSCIINIKKIYKEESYAVTMLFWSACDALSCITDIVQLSKKHEKHHHHHHHHNESNNNHDNKSLYPKTLEIEESIGLVSLDMTICYHDYYYFHYDDDDDDDVFHVFWKVVR